MKNGSPPRLWGTRRRWRRWPAGIRFTPTPVGNTPPGRLCGMSYTVHPHACGEHDSDSRGMLARRFTPTPVGNTVQFSCHVIPPRFTPTPVGNTQAMALPT